MHLKIGLHVLNIPCSFFSNLKGVLFYHYSAKMGLDINGELIAVNLNPKQASILTWDLDVQILAYINKPGTMLS